MKKAFPLTASYPFVVITICFCVFFSGIFMGKQSIPYDNACYFYPIQSFIASEYHAGRLPLWNPYIFAGYPSFADPQVGTFSPLIMTLLAIPENLSKRWFDVVEVLHIYIGGLFTFFLCRRLGAGVIASLLGSITYMFGGSAMARLQHVAHIYGYGYLSGAFYFLVGLLDKPRWREAVGLGVFCGLMLTVPTHITYLSALLMSAFIIVGFIRDLSYGSAIIWRKIRMLIVSCLLAFGMCVPQLYGLLLFLPLSNRPNFSYESVAMWSQSPLYVLSSFIPNFFGALWGKHWGPFDVTQSYFYLGTLPLVLWLFVAIKPPKRFPKNFFFFFCALIVYFIFSIGKYSGIFKLFFSIPGENLFRRPVDAEYVVIFCMAICTSFFLDIWLRLCKQTRSA